VTCLFVLKVAMNMSWVFLLGVVCGATAASLEGEQFPGIGDRSKVSVSGISSGGFAAVQLHVAFSDLFMGAAVLAAGPFYTAEGSLVHAAAVALSPNLINIQRLLTYTETQARRSAIDPTSNLKRSRVWLFSGTKDSVVKQGSMRKCEEYYQHYVNNTAIATVFDVPAEHAFVSDSWGAACNHLGYPFINNCNYNAARAMLTHIYGPMKPGVPMIERNLMLINQSRFLPPHVTAKSASLDARAYVYIPTRCQTPTASCPVHVALHGCLTSISFGSYNDTAIRHIGANEIAEANDIVVLYPQATQSLVAPINPEGCWDWWGYTGQDYPTKLAPQQVTIKNMVDFYTSKRAAAA